MNNKREREREPVFYIICFVTFIEFTDNRHSDQEMRDTEQYRYNIKKYRGTNRKYSMALKQKMQCC